MAIKLSDLVLMSDVDGTLLNREMELPQRNIDALRRFVDKGGRFGLATGRATDFALKLIERLPVNFPCVFSNGGVLYDVEAGEVLHALYLPDEADRFARTVAARFPDARIVVQARDGYFNVSDTGNPNKPGSYGNNMPATPLDTVPGPWHKILYIIDEAQRDEFFDFVDAQNFSGVRFVSTNEIMHEMLPADSSKGNALRRLLVLRGLPRERLVCIGDYYNDREMIELAGIGATLRSSPEDLKAIAQILVCDVDQGAVADLIEQLEAQFEN